MICFSYFYQKLSPKTLISRGFTNFFQKYWTVQHKLLILIESPNIFHWKLEKRKKVGVVLGQNLGQIRFNVVKKQKIWHYQ